jgi:hypothetical protein
MTGPSYNLIRLTPTVLPNIAYGGDEVSHCTGRIKNAFPEAEPQPDFRRLFCFSTIPGSKNLDQKKLLLGRDSSVCEPVGDKLLIYNRTERISW